MVRGEAGRLIWDAFSQTWQSSDPTFRELQAVGEREGRPVPLGHVCPPTERRSRVRELKLSCQGKQCLENPIIYVFWGRGSGGTKESGDRELSGRSSEALR